MRHYKLLSILLVLFFTSTAFAAQNAIIPNVIFNSRVVAASTTQRSVPIDLSSLKPAGFFSLHVSVTSGSGTAKIEYELSNTKLKCNDPAVVYVTPSSATDIVTAHTVTSGPDSDGNDSYSFEPELASCLKIAAAETGGINPITLTATLDIQ